MKKSTKLKLRAITIRVLDLQQVAGGGKATNTSGAGCDCWPDPLPPGAVQ